jgi:hypothetical protein
MEAGVIGDFRRLLRRIGLVPQRAWIERPAVGIELGVFPGQQRL